jgi:glucokinase
VVGVDVGGTKVAVARVDGTKVGEAREWPTELSSSEGMLDQIEAAVREMGEYQAVGIGVPSQIDWATGQVLSSVNIPLKGVALRQELGVRLGVPVFVDNDGNCAALAEAQILGAQHLLMLTLGTGVGGGIVIDGRVFRGATGLGAELGHVVVEADGPACPGNCPNRGCLEALCSGQALEREATELAKDKPDGRLGRAAADDGRVSGREAVAAAREGDEDALRLFESFGRWLGVGMASLVNAFEPEQLVIGGGLSSEHELFLQHAVREAGSRALPALWDRVTVSVARGGAAAGVIGAGLLAAQELQNPTNDIASRPTAKGIQ